MFYKNGKHNYITNPPFLAPSTLHPESASTISTSRNTPWLLWMPINIHNTKRALDLVALQHLNRNNRRILHQVRHNLSVENLQRSIVRSIGEEWVTTLVELDGTDGLLVETHGLVWAGREVEIVP